MTKHPELSIVIPTYNSSGTIGQAIQSLCNQELQNFNLYIVDDCSADFHQLCKVINDFPKMEISVLQLPFHKNGAAARNLGISAASGKYIAFCDSDDYWDSKKTITLHHAIKELTEPALIYHPVYCKKQSGASFVYPERGIFPDENISDYLFANNGLIQTTSITIPSSLTRKGLLFNENLQRHQDWDLVLRAKRMGIYFKYIDTPLSTWNIRPSLGKSKRESWKFSLQWLNDNIDCFTDKSKIYFLTQFILPRQLSDRSWSDSIKTIFTSLKMSSPTTISALASYLFRVIKKWSA